MAEYTILSWNVNGIRAGIRKGFLDWLKYTSPDILCVQETKAMPDQVKDLAEVDGYHLYWNSAQRKGYSGTLTFTREEPLSVINGVGMEEFDIEGRFQRLDFGDFVLMNGYYPSGRRSDERLDYKMRFYDAVYNLISDYKDRGIKVILCGDFNTAHKPIDLSHPEQNKNVSGFLPMERAWIDKLIGSGYIDTFREFVKDGGHYTWWDMRTRARERDIGWRLDYFFIDQKLKPHLKDAFIMKDVMGSDHCPVGITMSF